MKVTLENTATILTLNTPDGSVPVRVWEGMTESGLPIHAYVARVFANRPDDVARLDHEQDTMRDTSPLVLALVMDRESEPPT